MTVEVTAVSHACGRHHFTDTCDSKRDCARVCREKAFVGVLAYGVGEGSRVCVCTCGRAGIAHSFLSDVPASLWSPPLAPPRP